MSPRRSRFTRTVSVGALLAATALPLVPAAAETITLKSGETFAAGLPGKSAITGGAGDDWIYGDPAASDGPPTKVERVSLTGDGKEADADVLVSGPQAFSPDGRKLLLESSAKNLGAPSNPGGFKQVWLRDLPVGHYRLVSAVPATGAPGDGNSRGASMAPDGVHAVYASNAPLLTTQPAQSAADQVVAAKLSTGALTVLSRNRKTGAIGTGHSYGAMISRDGRSLAFHSYGSDLLDAGVDTNNFADVFVMRIDDYIGDHTSIRRASTNAMGGEGSPAGWQHSFDPALSANGDRIAFGSFSDALTTADGFKRDILVRRVAATDAGGNNLIGPITEVSSAWKADQALGDSYGAAFSPDGNELAFFTPASLVPGDGNAATDVYVRTLANTATQKAGSLRRLSTATKNGAIVSGDGSSRVAVYSPDGTRVAFQSKASNLTDGATGTSPQVMVKSLTNGVISLISRKAKGGVEGNGESGLVAFSPDGRQIAYSSEATNLVSGDTKGFYDVYLATLPAGPAGDDTLKGGAGRDHLFGGAGRDRVDGGAGADFLFGGIGDDVIVVDSAGDVVVERPTEGRDMVEATVTLTVPVNVENLILRGAGKINGTGNAAGNRITGNGAANVLSGLAGNDTLTGGRGRDRLTGGAGSDRFVYAKASDSPAGKTRRDTITDFAAADRIELSAIDANTGKKGNQAFRWIGSKRFSGKAGELRFRKGVLSADTDGDRKADLEIAVGNAKVNKAQVVK